MRSLHPGNVWRTHHHLELIIGDHSVMVSIRVAKHLQVVAGVCCPMLVIDYLINFLLRHRDWQSLHYFGEFLLQNNREIQKNI